MDLVERRCRVVDTFQIESWSNSEAVRVPRAARYGIALDPGTCERASAMANLSGPRSPADCPGPVVAIQLVVEQ